FAAAVLGRDRALAHARALDASAQAQVDALPGVLVLPVQEDLRHIDLAAQELLRQVWPVIRPIGVRAQDRYRAVVALLSQRERGGVTAAPAAHDHNLSLGHRLPPYCCPRAVLPERAARPSRR